MIRVVLPALALALVPTPAFADNDPRLVELTYDAHKVVTIEGQTKVQATVKFGDDEIIENVAIGDSDAWQVTPNKRGNLLFIKPLSPGARTNMTVVTSQRTYLFDLVEGMSGTPVYVLSFNYPDAPKDEQPVLAQGPTEVEVAAASDPYAVTDPADLNFAWAKTGEADLLPARAYDDGNATFLTWPAGRAVPAILIKDAKGTEGPVNFTVRGDTVVVDGVPREIILRSGKNEATLTNTGPVRPIGANGKAALAQAGETR